MVGAAVSLILGDDSTDVDSKISFIKNKFKANILAVADFNIDDVDGHSLTSKHLQEILKRLPLGSGRRLLIIRHIDYLSSPVLNCLFEFIKKIDKDNSSCFQLLLSAGQDKKKAPHRLISYLGQTKIANVLYCRRSRQQRVFDLARNIIDDGNYSFSIQLLRDLLGDGQRPTQILGGLFWYWNNSSKSKRRHRQGEALNLFLDTDMWIKTGRVDAELALELLVVKLCQSANC